MAINKNGTKNVSPIGCFNKLLLRNIFSNPVPYFAGLVGFAIFSDIFGYNIGIHGSGNGFADQCAFFHPLKAYSNIRAALRIVASGLAIFFPAACG